MCLQHYYLQYIILQNSLSILYLNIYIYIYIIYIHIIYIYLCMYIYMHMYIYNIYIIYLAFTTEGLFGIAIESWPEWDLNPRPLSSVQTL